MINNPAPYGASTLDTVTALIPLPCRKVARSIDSALDKGDDDSISWLEGMKNELGGLQGHNFWGKFKKACGGLCILAPEFRNQSQASSIAKTFITTLNTVIFRDVRDSFKEKRTRGDDGYSPYDKMNFYTGKYNEMYNRIFKSYAKIPLNADLQQELELLKEKFFKDLNQNIYRWEQAESLEYLAQLYSNIPHGLFVSEDMAERVYFECKNFNLLICTLQVMSDSEQSGYIQSLPFFPSNWPFTLDKVGLEKMRDEVCISWARGILDSLKILNDSNLNKISSEIDNQISRLGSSLERLGLQVCEVKRGIWRFLGKGEIAGYELKKRKNS